MSETETSMRGVDARIHEIFRGPVLRLGRGPVAKGVPVPAYTASLDAATGLAKEFLPGWIIGVTHSHRGDEVRLAPDPSHPEHGALFMRLWPDLNESLPSGPGLSVCVAPAGREAFALISAFIEVVAAIRDGRMTDIACPAFTDLVRREAENDPRPEAPADPRAMLRAMDHTSKKESCDAPQA